MFYINHTELIVIKLINFTLFEGENVFFLFHKKLQLQGFMNKFFMSLKWHNNYIYKCTCISTTSIYTSKEIKTGTGAIKLRRAYFDLFGVD